MSGPLTNRFAAAEAWMKRKGQYRPEDRTTCCYCTPESPEQRRERNHFASKMTGPRPNRAPRRSKRESRNKCQQSSKHFAQLYGLHTGKEVQNAAHVIRKLSLEIIQPIVFELERQLKIRARMKGSSEAHFNLHLKGPELLKIVKALLKEHNATTYP